MPLACLGDWPVLKKVKCIAVDVAGRNGAHSWQFLSLPQMRHYQGQILRLEIPDNTDSSIFEYWLLLYKEKHKYLTKYKAIKKANKTDGSK